MPSGNVHKKLWRANIPNALVCAAGMLFFSPVVAAGIVPGYMLGNAVEPDADLIQKTRAENEMIDRFGVLGCVWFGYWTVYGWWLRKSHRRWFSHGLIVSTAIRFAYLFWWWWFLVPPMLWLDKFMLGVFIGLVVSDSVHIFSDWFLQQNGTLKRRWHLSIPKITETI